MDVTILAILLGKAFHYDISELVSLAIASLLHDLGLQLFPDVCDKPNYIFTPDDWAIYYRHPTVGYELLNALDYFSLMERQTVYQHHEFQDGTGFPLGYFGANEIPIKYQMKEKGRIFRWAEVLAVADRYVQYCAGNFTEMPLNPSQALSAILREAGKILNSSIVAELIRLINIFPIGTPVRIVDSINSEIIGYEGVVCKENSKNMERPEIILLRSKKGLKITPRKIELAKDCSAKLELAI
jgi:HD-GYP domain-containing protein (c-di-GMP phosphodiesterase class II)